MTFHDKKKFTITETKFQTFLVKKEIITTTTAMINAKI